MGDTLSEIDAFLKLFNEVLPTAAGIAAAVDPAIAPALTAGQTLLTAVGHEIDIAAGDRSSGKSLADLVTDLVNGLPSQQPQSGSQTPATE